MKGFFLKPVSLIIVLAAIFAIAACGSSSSTELSELATRKSTDSSQKTYEDLIVGYSQIGAENK